MISRRALDGEKTFVGGMHALGLLDPPFKGGVLVWLSHDKRSEICYVTLVGVCECGLDVP